MEKDFPKYLWEIIRPTPSGTAKLLAAWSNLSLENQIQMNLRQQDLHNHLKLTNQHHIQNLLLNF